MKNNVGVCAKNAAVIVLLFLSLLMITLTECRVTCRISEFSCRNNNCIPADKYCDDHDDCGDKSDEPRFCSICNRTYYGEVQKTYHMVLQKPLESKLPYLCHLTFTANGYQFGDLLQLGFENFHIGRLESKIVDGCPDGYMQLLELGLPFNGGFWCGFSAGLSLYYSESSTVTLTLKLLYTGRYQSMPFEFKLRYKFIRKENAITRFGSSDEPVERGELVPGTYCGRNYYECYRKRCQIQSPNYPGFYPRNLTCRYQIRQTIVPKCKHVMISVKQKFDKKLQFKRSPSRNGNNRNDNDTLKMTDDVDDKKKSLTEKRLQVWNECDDEKKDRLVFYDGDSVQDRVLFKFCGGDFVPAILSRSADMLVVFYSSPFSVPMQNNDDYVSLARGFQLDVDTVFTDSDSYDFSRHEIECEFVVNASEADIESGVSVRTKNRSGRLASPRHTLSPNTTCTYQFKGQPYDRVWLSIASYWHENLLNNNHHRRNTSTINDKTVCPTRLQIRDGNSGRILGDHCNRPKICDHSALRNHSRLTRSCSDDESYLSDTSYVIMRYYSKFGTAVHPSRFLLYYEFVNIELGGIDTVPTDKDDRELYRNCSRLFKGAVKSDGEIYSPKNVFMYGRGGADRLNCLYRIEADPGEKIRLTVYNVSFGRSYNNDSICRNDVDSLTGKFVCTFPDSNESTNRLKRSRLEIVEVPWKNVRVQKTCLCDNRTLIKTHSTTTTTTTTTTISAVRTVEIRFDVYGLNAAEDFYDVYFYARYDFVRMPDCPRKQKIRSSGGEIEFNNPPETRVEIYCKDVPWLLEARDNNRSIFVLTWGRLIPVTSNAGSATGSAGDEFKCSTKNRILFYTGTPPRLFRVVCPTKPNDSKSEVHVFTEEWLGGSTITERLFQKKPPYFLIQFVRNEPGKYKLNWLEISRSRGYLSRQLYARADVHDISSQRDDTTKGNASSFFLLPPSSSDCPFRCPEIEACIDVELWCDGQPNCPSGFDELDSHCGFKLRLLKEYTIFSSLLLIIVVLLIVALILFVKHLRSNSPSKRPDISKMSSEYSSLRIGTQSTLYDPSSSTASS